MSSVQDAKPVLIPLLAGLLSAGASPAAVGTSVYFEQSTLSYIDGRPQGPPRPTRVWHAGRRMRLEAGAAPAGGALILRLDEGKGYRLDHRRQTAAAIDLEALRARSRMDLSLAAELTGTAEEGGVRTTELSAPRLIAGHRCQGFRIRAGSAVWELYLTRQLPVGLSAFTDFLEWSGASQALPGLLSEVRRLRGFPLQTRSRVTVMGQVHETLCTVTRVEVGAVSPALFEPPPGYRLEEEGGEGS